MIRSWASGRSHLGFPLVGAVAAIALWWSVAEVFEIRTLFLPTPADIVEAFGRAPGYLFREAAVTLTLVLGGFAIATLAGLSVAGVLAAFRTVERATLPLIIALHAIPKVALAPLLVLWMGYGTVSKLSLAALICFFPILIATLAGLTSTPAELGELALSLSASRWQTFIKVRAPWAVPQIFTGLKLGISLAVIGTVVAELTTPNRGLGAVIVHAGASFDIPVVFAAITLLMAMSIGLFYGVVFVEQMVAPWAKETVAERG